MFIFPERLRTKTVVVVNEYYGPGMFSPGHMNITFYRYGRLERTFGQNQEGRDAKGRLHKAQLVVRRDYVGMLGGVFIEGNDRSHPHF